MKDFSDFYKSATDISNCTLLKPENKVEMKDAILLMCISFSRQYMYDDNFRQEAEEFARSVRSI